MEEAFVNSITFLHIENEGNEYFEEEFEDGDHDEMDENGEYINSIEYMERKWEEENERAMYEAGLNYYEEVCQAAMYYYDNM